VQALRRMIPFPHSTRLLRMNFPSSSKRPTQSTPMSRIISMLAFVLCAFLLPLAPPLYGADGPTSGASLQQQVEKLKAENEALKQENQVLRKLVFEKQNPSQATTKPQPPTSAPAAVTGIEKPPTTAKPAPTPAAQGYWMTNSSGKRHNSGCRYYQNSNGHPCGPNDGIPCKICGG